MKFCKWIFVVLSLLFLNFCARAEPTSGIIVTSEYGTKEGVAVGQKRGKRIWFQGANVRIENLIGDDVTEVTVGGENSWSASPSAERILFENTPRDANDKAPLSTYPEIVRRNFARIFGKLTPVSKEDIKGLPCWKYQWHEDELDLGDIKSAAQDVTHWVYADEQFPMLLARKSSSGGIQKLMEFRLNENIAPELFVQPKNWPIARDFQLPKRPFLIEFQEERESLQYGWKLHSSDIFEGDGEKITRTFKQATTQNNETKDFMPPLEILTYEQARDAIWNRLQTPEWYGVKKTGEEQIFNLKIDVLEKIIEGLAPEKFFVADHVLLGTICLKQITKMPTDDSTRHVTRLEFP